MKTVKKDPPSYKDILMFLAYPQFAGARGGADGPILPSNANAFLKFAMGSESGLTEKDFNEGDMGAILSLIKSAKSKGREGHVNYYDYPKSNVDQEKGMHVMKDKTDAMGRVMTTLGQFEFEEGDDGYTIKDSYDFNYPDVYKEMLSKETGLSIEDLESQGHIERFLKGYKKKTGEGSSMIDAAYSSLRTNVTPFIERSPMAVNLKVKKK